MLKFNSDQLTAINHADGPMLVLAGPGSGKTAVTTARTVKIAAERCGNGEKILAITFTKAAADEMKGRYEALINNDTWLSEKAAFGTFHSVFLSILKKYIVNFSPKLAERRECISILKEILNEKSSDKPVPSDYCGILLSDISAFKNGINRHKENNSGFEELVSKYDKRLHRKGYIDYDDMLLLCLKLLYKDRNVLDRLKAEFKYISVDEFQDINSLQFRILYLLSAPEFNIFAVGDDDQSIYGFRGSDPSFMLSFSDYFRGTKLVCLSVNYRSDEMIVGASLSLIEHNKKRYKKRLSAAKSGGSMIDIRGFYSGIEMAETIVHDAAAFTEETTAAVLFRTHRAGKAAALAMTSLKAACKRNISLMTFHASKGLEFDVVYIIEADDDITPGKNRDRQAVEEERRMFYVAMTRARSRLHIFYTKSHYNTQSKKSRFIGEIG